MERTDAESGLWEEDATGEREVETTTEQNEQKQKEEEEEEGNFFSKIDDERCEL